MKSTMMSIRKFIINNKINNGIFEEGLYRTLNFQQTDMVIDYDWTNNPTDIIVGKAMVFVFMHNEKLYAVSIDNDGKYSAFYQIN
jgi:hypothetical protein